MLRDLLAKSDHSLDELLRLRSALAHPWAWPHDEQLRVAALKLGFTPPSPPIPGEACLVSVTPTADRRALWRLTRDKRSTWGFAGLAREMLGVAMPLATRGVPLVVHVESILRPQPDLWVPVLVDKEGAGTDTSLDGSSYGLSIILAAGSLIVGQALPADMIASVGVSRRGDLEEVESDSIEQKLRIVSGSGLGVRRFMVHASQESLASDIARRVPGAPRIVKVDTLEDAFRLCYPGDSPVPWRSGVEARRALENIWNEVLDGSVSLGTWDGAAATGRRLLAEVEDDPGAVAQATQLVAIAERHGGAAAPIPWPEEASLRGMRRPHRLKLLAHVLQSHADADTRAEAVLEMVEEARRKHLAASPVDDDIADLHLRGAIGRALAAAGAYRPAARELTVCVDGWIELNGHKSISRSLSELLRVSGLLGDHQGVESRVELVRDQRVPANDRPFLYLAAGRAFVLLRLPQRALEYLDQRAPVGWELHPDLDTPRHRWLARAQDGAAQGDQARATRSYLARVIPTRPEHDSVLLARIDQALVDDDSAAVLRAIDELMALIPHETRRFLDPTQDWRARAQRLADHYRY